MFRAGTAFRASVTWLIGQASPQYRYRPVIPVQGQSYRLFARFYWYMASITSIWPVLRLMAVLPVNGRFTGLMAIYRFIARFLPVYCRFYLFIACFTGLLAVLPVYWPFTGLLAILPAIWTLFSHYLATI